MPENSVNATEKSGPITEYCLYAGVSPYPEIIAGIITQYKSLPGDSVYLITSVYLFPGRI